MTHWLVHCLSCNRDSELFSPDPQPVQIPCRYCGGPAECKAAT